MQGESAQQNSIAVECRPRARRKGYFLDVLLLAEARFFGASASASVASPETCRTATAALSLT
jgi:hypothetical protein